MHVIGPPLARLLLNAFVVVVGFLILAGAVNTAIIGSNGVLNRVAEDGVMPDWFLRPHRRFGTTHRVLYLIVGLQLLTILLSRGNMYVLGEAYAFGVVWSFVFKALAMVVLRFKDRSPREFKVPLNIRIRGVEVPIGLTADLPHPAGHGGPEHPHQGGGHHQRHRPSPPVFLAVFMASEHIHEKTARGGRPPAPRTIQPAARPTRSSPASLGLTKPYRKLVAIRSPQNLFMLEKALAETDPETTEVVVMTAKWIPPGERTATRPRSGSLRPAADDRRGRRGRRRRASRSSRLILPTNNPLFAIVNTASDAASPGTRPGGLQPIHAPTSRWSRSPSTGSTCIRAQPTPLTVRILSRNRDVYSRPGRRQPHPQDRRAPGPLRRRTAVRRASASAMPCWSTTTPRQAATSSMPCSPCSIRRSPDRGSRAHEDADTHGTPAPPEVPVEETWVRKDIDRAGQLRREVAVVELPPGDVAEQLVRLAEEQNCDVVIIGLPSESSPQQGTPLDTDAIVRHASCWVCLVSWPIIPREAEVEPLPPSKPSPEKG